MCSSFMTYKFEHVPYKCKSIYIETQILRAYSISFKNILEIFVMEVELYEYQK
jgi:hypothetical protein